jgi:HK97 family phage major capsid protein
MDEDKITNEAIPPSGMGEEEAKRVEKSALMSLVANIVQNERDNWMTDVVNELKEFTEPDRSSVPEIQNRQGETVHRLESPAEPLYRRMSPEMRKVRCPDGDHWMAEWLRGQFHKDRARMFMAEQQLDHIYGRATVTEGVAGGDGAISTGTGGYLIPRPLEAVVMIERDRVAKMRRFATIYQMTAQQHTIPTAASMTAYMVNEDSTSATGEPSFSHKRLIARKARCLAVATQEVLADAAVNLVNLFAVRAGAAIGTLEDDQFFSTGNGTPPNIEEDISGTEGHSMGISTTLQYADVIGMYFAVPQQYRDNARWLVAANVLQGISGLVSNGMPFYQGMQERPLPTTDDPQAVGTLLGKPVYEVPFPSGEIFFGDVAAAYAVGNRQGIQSSASEHVYFDTDGLIWKFTARFAGINIDASASDHQSGITAVSVSGTV